MGKTASLANIGSIADSSLGFRNRIINPQMQFDQRNAGASTTPTTDAYNLDRWILFVSQMSKLAVQRSSTAPAGFVNSTLFTSQSSYSVTSSDYFYQVQKVEGNNVTDLAWGTASAAPVTLSFWVRSSLTGTFGGVVKNSAQNRSYPFSYAVNAANTWEQKSITIVGDTSGTWDTGTNTGIFLGFSLGAGSTFLGAAGSWSGNNYVSCTGETRVVGTNGATFYITGVQLEKGSTATAFDYRSYGTELALCQRYYFKVKPTVTNTPFGVGFSRSTTQAVILTNFPVSMRVAPSALEQTGSASDYAIEYNATGTLCSAVPTFSKSTEQSGSTFLTTASGLTAGQGSFGRNDTTNAYLAWSAEL